jgi:hypothetical protein
MLLRRFRGELTHAAFHPWMRHKLAENHRAVSPCRKLVLTFLASRQFAGISVQAAEARFPRLLRCLWGGPRGSVNDFNNPFSFLLLT